MGADTVQMGAYLGVRSGNTLTFSGVRYAVAETRTRVRDLRDGDSVQATPAIFPQQPGALDGVIGTALAELPQSDDAFQLSVQAPVNAVAAPVVFFIPGGGFLSGSGQVRWYGQSALPDLAGVVLVTVNYRLGLSAHGLPGVVERDGCEESIDADVPAAHRSAETNASVRDLLRALVWVRKNIAQFGGDPSKLTIAGDSAGAWYAYALSALEHTRGWFERTVLVSMPRISPHSREVAEQLRVAVHLELGDRSIDAVSPAELLRIQNTVMDQHRELGMVWRPHVSAFVPADIADFRVSAQRLHVRELVMLRTADEAAAFLSARGSESVTSAAVDHLVDRTFASECQAHTVIRAAGTSTLSGSPYAEMVRAITLADFALPVREIFETVGAVIRCYAALISWQSPVANLGAPHMLAVPCVLGNIDRWYDAPMWGAGGLSSNNSVMGVASEVTSWMAAVLQGDRRAVSDGLEAGNDEVILRVFGSSDCDWVREEGRGLRLAR